ncbi:hypothetical protein CR513_42318, partial [Mucuna pruriens]
MVTMFIDTLSSPYYDKVVRNVASSFADLVAVGERIEVGIRQGKFAPTNSSAAFAKKTASRKKKGESNAVLIETTFPRVKINTSSYPTQAGSQLPVTQPTPYIPPSQPCMDAGATANARPTQQAARRSHKVLTPIPMTYTKLFPLLLEQKLIEVVPLKPFKPPYPRSYDPNARLLGFEDKGPIVHNNPLSVHGTASINTISHMDERVVATKPVYNNNAVPWRYPTPQIKEETRAPEITNIVRTGGMTRSGRILSPDTLRNKESTPTEKEKTTKSPKRTVMEEEAREFLKVIRHSEYELLDQMHKTPDCISLLLLLINSKSHRELLLKILNEAHVPQDIMPAKFEGIINNITTSHHLSFSEEEVSDEGRNHNQPLHIAAKCGNYMIARVLIDNGSSLNVMPKNTLDKLYFPSAILRNSPILVKAFDGSKREVMGKFTLPIRIGPTTFYITFQLPAGQALDTCHGGTTSIEMGSGDIKPSKATIMATKVLIANGFKLGKGLGRRLDDMANPVVVQENPG